MWKLRLISANELKPSQAQVPLFAVIAHIARKMEIHFKQNSQPLARSGPCEARKAGVDASLERSALLQSLTKHAKMATIGKTWMSSPVICALHHAV